MLNVPDSGSPLFDAVLLAGGRSRRMGQPKGMLEFRGSPWIRHQVNEFVGINARRIAVVVGEHSEAYRRALIGVPDRVQIVLNADFDAPPFASLQLGLLALGEEEAEWVWVQPLDTVVPDHLTCATLLQQCANAPENAQVVRPAHEGRNGHPVILRKGLCCRMSLIPAGDDQARLDHQIKALGEDQVITVPVDSGDVLLDFNLPDQWQNFVRR